MPSDYSQNNPDSIRDLFGSIASGYDRANAVLSLGLYRSWNRSLVKIFADAEHLLDLCAGTGDIAFGFLKSASPSARATLLDFCPQMLACARKKGIPHQERFTLVEADAERLPFTDASFDAVSVAYGIRNLKNPDVCFREAYRVLQDEGTFAILELTRPKFLPLRLGHSLYLRSCIPILGKLVAKNKGAYTYLSRSIHSFADPKALAGRLKQVGFGTIKIKPLLGGTATLICAKKLSLAANDCQANGSCQRCEILFLTGAQGRL